MSARSSELTTWVAKLDDAYVDSAAEAVWELALEMLARLLPALLMR